MLCTLRSLGSPGGRANLTSWCTGGSRCPPGAAACWGSSCCGPQISSHCGRRCQESRSYWPAGCSGGGSSWDHQTSAFHLSRTAGKRRRWCIPSGREERDISCVLLSSRGGSSAIEETGFWPTLGDTECGVGLTAVQERWGSAHFWITTYPWCQNVPVSVSEHCREAAAQPTVARAGPALLHHHLCPDVFKGGRPLCAAARVF